MECLVSRWGEGCFSVVSWGCQDMSLLPNLGFQHPHGLESVPPELVSGAVALAQDFVRLIVGHMSEYSWDWTYWSDIFPNRLGGLLHNDQEKLKRCKQEIRKLWTNILALEKLLFTEKGTTAADVERQLLAKEATYPQTARLYKIMDVCSDQFTRCLAASVLLFGVPQGGCCFGAVGFPETIAFLGPCV